MANDAFSMCFSSGFIDGNRWGIKDARGHESQTFARFEARALTFSPGDNGLGADTGDKRSR